VTVNGFPVRNPRSFVAADAVVRVEAPSVLRGTLKLRAALDAFGVDPTGRVCADLGASTGGFTVALLERGASRVYAIDVGYGELLGSLRQDPRVVVMEKTNLADALVEEPVGLITMDLAYLSIASAVVQLGGITPDRACEMVALVKPMFELGLSTAPTDRESLKLAIEHASVGLERCGWRVTATMTSPVPGGRGALEGFVHAVHG
jgi:23S rRNA (cytidine1920-2'-O)/16S rRNA (cytidine1409-2'-O)-methyltransferase